jgi:sec-independent protein translocase protein TatC
MLRPRDDDLFKDSTMTFGEHLEELRASLMKAVISIGIGTVVGFFLGQGVVDAITAPLQRALINYYQYSAWEYYKSWSQQQEAAGKTPPYSLAEVEYLLMQRKLIYQIHQVHPHVLARTLEVYDRAHAAPAAEARGAAGQAASPVQRVARRDNAPGRTEGPAPNARAGSARQSRQPARGQPPGQRAGPTQERQSAEAAEKPNVLDQGTERAAASATPSDDTTLVPLFAWYPLREDPRIKPTTLGAPEGFMIYLKASLVVGIILSSPFAFYFIWSFIAAGLYPHEKRYVYVFAPFSLALFLSGAALAYFFVFGPVLNFLFDFNRSLGLEPDLRISEWLSFVLLLPLGFGVSFQLPLVMLFLERLGILTVQAYLAKWRIAVMVIVVLSAVLTPADPVSVWFMLVPLLCLYFGGILLCKWMPRARRPA